MDNVESAKKQLVSDLEDCPLVVHDPIGDARTYIKTKQYLFSCIVERKDRAESKDWLYKLYEEQTDDEKYLFVLKLDLLANALYDFYYYLQNNRIV
jgi:hypothetical protein